MLRQYLHQLLPFKNCSHYADFIILEMLWWRFWKRQSGEFCIVCNWILCFCIRYRNAAITEHGSLSRDNLFCTSRIVHPYRRNQPWFQAYTSVCPRGARRENGPISTHFVFMLCTLLNVSLCAWAAEAYCLIWSALSIIPCLILRILSSENFSLQNPWCAAKRRILLLDFEYDTESVREIWVRSLP